MDAKVQGKPVRESRVEMVEIALPNDANTVGSVLGGKVLHLIDIAGAIAAHRHSRHAVVTASIDEVDFRYPIRVGQMILLFASVNYVARSSMEVGVKVVAEDPISGERRHTSTAYLTFVALGADGHPTAVPPLVPETPEEKRRYDEAAARRARRLEALAARRSGRRRSE
jgi:acyl-CoA hydrolase